MWRGMAGLALACIAFAAPATGGEDDAPMAAAKANCPGFARYARAQEDAAARRRAGPAAAPSEPALRERLLAMRDQDQQARGGDWTPAALQRMAEVDARHLPQIKRIVAEHGGLPSAAQVGADGVAAAWLLVQHADADPGFQADVLAHMAPLLERGEVTGQELGLLSDRVLVGQGRLQRYGSQLTALHGRWVPAPIEDARQVDARRAAIGLMPLRDYLCMAMQLNPPPGAADD